MWASGIEINKRIHTGNNTLIKKKFLVIYYMHALPT